MVDPEGLANRAGERPFVRDTRTRRRRERDFRAEARDKVGDRRWRGLDEAQRRAQITRVREAWARDAVGTVPDKLTYDEWLRDQPAAFQDDVLGPSRGKLFRQGAKLDKFVDNSGKTLTLEQLRKVV